MVHCIFCKSTHHTYRHCPLAFMKSVRQVEQEYTGESPNVFIGQYGYPNVRVGLLNVEEYTEQDEPKRWRAEGKSIPEIVDLRTQLVNSTFQSNVRRLQEKTLELGRAVGMATKPVEMEVRLSKRPLLTPSFHGDAQPHGPSAPLERARITGNVKVDTRVEKVVNDNDLKSAPALTSLYKKGFDEHALRKLFSTGNLGLKSERKLVPTRWSITAVDDTLGKELIKEVKQLPEGDCFLYRGGYLGNEYLILTFDDVWSYELFEGYVPSLKQEGVRAWEHDVEGYDGRKTYVEETAGGYYAARLAILEELRRRRRQGAVLALRFITTDYSVPLGVWVVREAVRAAMSAKPLRFPDLQHLIAETVREAKERFGIDVAPLLRTSVLLSKLQSQTRLRRWFSPEKN